MSSCDPAQFQHRLDPERGFQRGPAALGDLSARQPDPRPTADLNRLLTNAATRAEQRTTEEAKSDVGSIQLGIAAAGQVIVDLALVIGRLERRLGVVLQPEAPTDSLKTTLRADPPRTELASRLDTVLCDLRGQVRRLSALTDQVDI